MLECLKKDVEAVARLVRKRRRGPRPVAPSPDQSRHLYKKLFGCAAQPNRG
jgi:hypothetical protein